MAHHFCVVDVFAAQPYAGNPLAVVVGGQGLTDETMRLIAAETNYSETTFVSPVPEEDGGFGVRIFTPAREVAGIRSLAPHRFCAGTLRSIHPCRCA
jgi:trans-2,3-dihydro-3-hydroxyanthranilate isomerase